MCACMWVKTYLCFADLLEYIFFISFSIIFNRLNRLFQGNIKLNPNFLVYFYCGCIYQSRLFSRVVILNPFFYFDFAHILIYFEYFLYDCLLLGTCLLPNYSVIYKVVNGHQSYYPSLYLQFKMSNNCMWKNVLENQNQVKQ